MNYSQKLLEIQRQFENTQYELLLLDYCAAYVCNDTKRMDEILSKLPTEIQLLEALVEKLRGKSVFNNLKKIIRGESVDPVNHAIGISSLITHVLIECKNNKEYKMLLPDLYTKLGKLI